MIVKEVLEILHSNGIDVTEEDFIYRLENLDVEDATLDTDLKDDVLKKLTKKYGVDFKKKKSPKAVKEPVKEKETPVVKEEPKKEEKVEPKKEEKKVEPKVETKKEEQRPEPVKAETKVEPKKEEKKPEPKPQPKVEEKVISKPRVQEIEKVAYVVKKEATIDERTLKKMETALLESDPLINKKQAHFYVRHCAVGRFYTIQQFKKAEGCVYETARTSMDNLAKRGYYRRENIKNKFVYTPIDKE